MATISGVVAPGKIFQEGEPQNNAKLNQLGRPTFYFNDDAAFWQWLLTNETITGNSAIDVSKRIHILNGTVGGPFTLTLASGSYLGQWVQILCLNETSSAPSASFGKSWFNAA